MKLKFNTSVTMSTGNTGTAIVLETFNDRFKLSKLKFEAEIQVWKSQADKDEGKDHAYLFNSGIIKRLEYTIPDADVTQAGTDGHYGIIGQNHPTRIKDELASLLGIDAADIEITSLL